MELLLQKKQELLNKKSLEERERAENLFLEKLNTLSQYVDAHRADITKHINSAGLNAVAIVLSVFKPPTNALAPSRSLKVMLGSLRGSNIDPGRILDGYIVVDVQAPVEPGAAGKVHKKPDPNAPPYAQKFIYEFAPLMISVPKDAAEGLAFGDMIYLLDIKARAYFTKDETHQELIAINVGGCDKVSNYTMADTFYSMLTGGFRNSRLAPLKQKYKPSDATTKYSDEIWSFKIKKVNDTEDLYVPGGSIVTPQFTNNEKDWFREDQNKVKSMVMRPLLEVIQWDGDDYESSPTPTSIIIEFNCYHEALVGFYITNPDIWQHLGPVVTADITMLAMCSVRVDMTESMPFNVMKARAEESNDYTAMNNIPYDMGFVMTCVGILMDAPSQYIKIGIPLSPAAAQELDKKMLDESDAGVARLKARHIANLHSKTNRPPMICMAEYQGDKSKIWNDPDVKFVVVTDAVPSAAVKGEYQNLTNEEGDELFAGLMQPNSRLKNPKLMQLRQQIHIPAVLHKYLFAIYKSRLCNVISTTAKLFIEGLKAPSEDDDIGLLGAPQTPSQPEADTPAQQDRPRLTNGEQQKAPEDSAVKVAVPKRKREPVPKPKEKEKEKVQVKKEKKHHA